MKKAAVIGSPITHSLSPAIFAFLRQRIGRADFSYESIEVKPEELNAFIDRAKQEFMGLNVTIPHKENIISSLTDLDAPARAIQAANVVHFSNGIAKGFNTDVVGVTETLRAEGVECSGRDVLLIGAGGAARAVAFSLATFNAKRIYIFNKTIERAQRLAREFGTHFPQVTFTAVAALEDIDGRDFHLAVNATPLGMTGAAGAAAASGGFAKIFAAVKIGAAFDLIYKPATTPFMKTAEEAGARVFGGLEMLAYQAMATWEIWFGKITNQKDVARDLLEHLRKLTSSSWSSGGNIFLTGFMGVGKSTVGRILAERTGKKFLDVDDEVVKVMKKPVGRIFQEDGEEKFRAVEAEIVAKICGESGLVVSLGGGALGTPGTLEKIKSSGRVFYLSATIDELTARLERSKQRPLMAGAEKEPGGIRGRVTTLLLKREDDYRKSDHEIVTAGRPSTEIAAEIADKLSERRE